MSTKFPSCPKCGSEMILRTARKGRNAGNKFYGCSNYPRCKGTLDIKEVDENGNIIDFEHEDYDISGSDQEIQVPKLLTAREKFKNCQVRFYETIAVPIELLEEITVGNVDKKQLRNFNQWRLDYPIKSDSFIDEKIKQVLLVAYKILTRGHITLPSPSIEKEYKKYFEITDFNINKINLSSYYSLISVSRESDVWFDGRGMEKDFYEDILFDILGPYYKKFIIPQVHFSSLIDEENIDDSTKKQRVDFLITTSNKRIVVELDDGRHKKHQSRDDNRNYLLTEAGFKIVRIENSEINDKKGPNIHLLQDLLRDEKIPLVKKVSNIDKYLLTIKLIHQLQIIILESILSGFVNLNKKTNIYFDAASITLNKKDLLSILKNAKDDLSEVIRNLSALYDVEIDLKKIDLLLFNSKSQKEGIVISFNENLPAKIPKFIVQDISFSGIIAHSDRPVKFAKIESPKESTLEYFLRYIFRHNKFLEGQFEAISRALIGEDTIVLLPTGAGKSVAFQLASMLLPGVTIVIDPIIALIDDQLNNLEGIGIDRTVGITSQITDPEVKSKIINIFGQGEYILCYVAPERFQTEEFRSALETLRQCIPISLIAIDEAHCVSEWGHDFRTSYLNIGRVSREYCKFEGHIPPLLALTGTASSSVLRDVQRELQIKDFDAIITPKTFDREEIHFSVFDVASEEKFNVLKGILQKHLPEKFNTSSSSFYQINGRKTNSGLLFCPHIGGTFGVVENAQRISNELGIQAHFYGGHAPKRWKNNYSEWSIYKRRVARDYKHNKFPLLVATKSFGMGIDKQNIRYTIHFGIPNSIEAFYQEAGRAGRDRKRAEGIILISNDDKERTSKLLDPDTTPEVINKIMEEDRDWDTDDDITRAIWFHSQAFRGVKNELSDIDEIVRNIGDLSKKRKINLVISNIDRNSIEKGLHRLIILGVASDYTIDYSTNEFHIKLSGIEANKIIDNYAKYVAGYNKGRVISETGKLRKFLPQEFHDFVKSASEVLIEFIYDTIEKGRRRALNEILKTAEAAINNNADKIVRERILRYLESTYSEEIEKIINETRSFKNLKRLIEGHEELETGEIVGGIRAPKDAMEIRGQTARYLESTPDHPGLLFLRALSELYCRNFDLEVILQNILAAISFSFSRYNIEKDEVYNNLVWMLTEIYEKRNKIYSRVILKVLYTVNDKRFAEIMIENESITEDMMYEPGVYLFNKISNEAIRVFN